MKTSRMKNKFITLIFFFFCFAFNAKSQKNDTDLGIFFVIETWSDYVTSVVTPPNKYYRMTTLFKCHRHMVNLPIDANYGISQGGQNNHVYLYGPYKNEAEAYAKGYDLDTEFHKENYIRKPKRKVPEHYY